MIYSIYLLIIFLLLYLTGHVLLGLLNIAINKSFLSVFTKLVAGLFSIVLTYSLIKTNFCSVNTGIIIILLMLWMSYDLKRPKLNFSFSKLSFLKTELWVLLALISFVLIIFFYYYYYIFCTKSSIPVVIYWDNWFFSGIAMFMNHSGRETIITDVININTIGTSPYHYFEMWFMAFTTAIFNSNYYFTTELVCVPVFHIIIISGCCAIIENYSSEKKYLIFGLYGLLIGSFYCDEFVKITGVKWGNDFAKTAFDEPWLLKFSIAYIIIISAYLFFANNKFLQGIIVLFSLAVVSITLTPSILSATLIFLFSGYLFRKRIHWFKFKFSYLFYPLIILFFINIFYYINTVEQFITKPSVKDVLYSFYYLLLDSKDVFIVLTDKIKDIIILYSPFLLLLFVYSIINKKFITGILKENKALMTFVIIITFIFFISFIYWQAFYWVFASKEFFFYAITPFTNILFFILIIKILVSKRKLNFIKILALIVILSSTAFYIQRNIKFHETERNKFENKYSNKYLSEISRYNTKLSYIGAKIENYNKIKPLNPYMNYSCGGYLSAILDEFSLVSLSFCDFPEDYLKDVYNKNFITNAPFYKFVKNQKKENKFENISKSKLDFILKYKINYIIVGNEGQIDNILLPYVQKIIKDPSSGENFIILNINN